MLINIETGELYWPRATVEGLRISKSLTKSEFADSQLRKQSSVWLETEKNSSFVLPTSHYMGERFGTVLIFDSQQLTTIWLQFSLYPIDATWNDWSLDTEVKTREFQDSILRLNLGSPHIVINQPSGASEEEKLNALSNSLNTYQFDWGQVNSGYDRRSECCRVSIIYS